MAKEDFHFFFPFRVRYAETDAQGIVFNAHYFTYLDTAIYEYFRDLPYDFLEHVRRTGADFHTVRVEMAFLGPSAFDDELEVYVRPSKIGRSSLTFAVEIYRKGEEDLLIQAEVVWVNTDQKARKSVPLPEGLLQRLRGKGA